MCSYSESFYHLWKCFWLVERSYFPKIVKQDYQFYVECLKPHIYESSKTNVKENRECPENLDPLCNNFTQFFILEHQLKFSAFLFRIFNTESNIEQDCIFSLYTISYNYFKIVYISRWILNVRVSFNDIEDSIFFYEKRMAIFDSKK